MSDWVADQFEERRPRLRAIAYRLLGSTVEADDAVQEIWLRLSRTGAESIDNLGGWLTTVVSRICLDLLRSRRSRREDPVGATLADAAPARNGPEEPDYGVVLADSIGPALLVVLDSLDPRERLAFVLHDLFGVPFAEIAPIVGRSPTATRQLASRGRRRFRGHSEGEISTEWGTPTDPRQRELVDAFLLAACRRGGLRGALRRPGPGCGAPHRRRGGAYGRGPTGAGSTRPQRRAPGPRRRGRGVRRASGSRTARSSTAPGAVWAPEDRPRSAFVMVWEDGKIVEIEIIADLRRLRTLEIAL